MKRFAQPILLASICLLSVGLVKPGRSAAPPGLARAGGDGSVALSAEQLYQRALRVQDLWWQPGESGIHLQRGIVVQNDSPGCGKRDDDAGVFEELSANLVLRKELEISGPLPHQAQIAFIAKERLSNDAELEFVVNGNVVVRRSPRFWAPDAKQYLVPDGGDPAHLWGWARWQYQEIPGEYLRTGKNTILIRSREGKPGWAFMVADYADFHKGCAEPLPFPKTSAKSEDGGKTWRQDDLGSKGQISGEYVVRILLGSYHPAGLLSSEVVDLAGETATFKTLREVQAARIRLEAKTGPTTELRAEVRSGASPVYEAEHWSAWVDPAADGTVPNLRGRYLQWRIKFSSGDPETSPELNGLVLEAVAGHHSLGKIRVVREDNFDLRSAPEGYRYEDYESAYLQKFRRRFQLDAVVAGAHTEWERQLRLMRWAYLVPLLPYTPIFPWDPLAWIDERRLPDALAANTYPGRRRDAMCLFSNVTLVAALESFGYPARHVNLASEGLSGHEIAEVWSNQFGKWIYLDATIDAFWYDKGTGMPVNTLEMHKGLAARLEQPETWQHPFLYTQRPETYLLNSPIAPADSFERLPIPQATVDWTNSATTYLRIVPRGDVFSHPAPLPVSQGSEPWCWDGYLNWADAKVPPLPHFSHYTNREADFNWPLNQVRYVVEETATPGLVNVTLDHNMPYLAALLARVDGGQWKVVQKRFPWTLHAGVNTLELRGRNSAGVEGMTSGLILEYSGNANTAAAHGHSGNPL
jgi:hypothetical protein